MDRGCGDSLWCSGWSYVDSFCGVVLLIEAIWLFIWMRKHETRWLALLPLALALGAFSLAFYMWDLYAQSVGYPPHFPLDPSQGVVPVCRPYGDFTTALLFALVLVPGLVRSFHMRQVLAGYGRRVRKDP
jgi:hypothetical protein